MEKALCVAKVLFNEYNSRYNEEMDQMKMHKLMYFVQRESLMYNKEVLFGDEFLGWKYGPVLNCVRSQYSTGVLFSEVVGDVSRETKELVDSVLKRYGTMSSWKLSSLSHREFSWKCSRKGLGASENGSKNLSLESMKVDAARELEERKKSKC